MCSSPLCQHNPGEVVHPVNGSAAGTQGVLEAAVEPIHYTVAFWVVGGGLHALDA